MMTIKMLKGEISKIKKGETFYINAINLTPSAIDALRVLLWNEIIQPVESELQKVIKPEYITNYKRGFIIAPQMTYIKMR